MIIRMSILAVMLTGWSCACSQPEFLKATNEQKESTPVEQSVQQLTVVKDSVRVTVRLLSAKDILNAQLAPRRMTKKDFEPILKDEYVNYAEGINSDLLTLYNVYKEYQADQIRDYWGNPLFSQHVLSPLLDDDFHPRFTVFDIEVENLRGEKIRLDMASAALVTNRHDQVPVITKEDLRTELEQFWARFSLSPYALNSSVFSREYFERNIQIFQRVVFSTRVVHSHARVRGLVFFPRLENDVRSFTFFLPDVSILRNNVPTSIDFEVEFANE